MEEIQQKTKKKIKWQIIISIILAIFVVAVFVYLDYRDKPEEEPKPNGGEPGSIYKPQPISPSENPKRAIPLDPEKASLYGCAGPQHLEGITIKQPDSIWEIKNNGDLTRVSLGKYRIDAPANTVFDIQNYGYIFLAKN
jgi:hypothetical protein